MNPSISAGQCPSQMSHANQCLGNAIRNWISNINKTLTKTTWKHYNHDKLSQATQNNQTNTQN